MTQGSLTPCTKRGQGSRLAISCLLQAEPLTENTAMGEPLDLCSRSSPDGNFAARMGGCEAKAGRVRSRYTWCELKSALPLAASQPWQVKKMRRSTA